MDKNCRNLERNLSIHRLDFVNEKLVSKKSVENLFISLHLTFPELFVVVNFYYY